MCGRGEISLWRAAAAVFTLGAAVTAAPGQAGPATKPAEALNVRFGLPGVQNDAFAGLDVLRAPVKAKEKLQGYIDWSRRLIVAVGRSLQQGNRPADILMARRAAGVIAMRNAVALSLGIRIGLNGRVDGLKNGRVVIQAFIKGFVVTKSYTEKVAGKSYGVAEVHVPMFGFKSVAGRMYDAQLAAHRTLVAAWQRARWPAAVKPDDRFANVILVDARGTGFRTNMFPVFLNERNEILLDMVTVGKQVSINHGLCSYATTKLTFQRLQSSAPLPPKALRPVDWAAGPAQRGQNVDGVDVSRLLLAQAAGGDKANGSATQPATRRFRRRRRFVLRAKPSKDKQKAVLVVADKDALKLLKDPNAAHLAKNGRVLVVVDAAAAGVEGRLPPRYPRRPGVDIAAHTR